MGLHSRGLDILGATDAVVRRIQFANTAAYRANMAGGDRPGSAVERDIETRDGAPVSTEDVTVLQIGDDVTVLGPAAMSEGKKPISYTPVAVAGRDGAYWVRTAALGSTANYLRAGVIPLAKPASEPVAAWKVAVGAGAGIAALAGILALVFRRRTAARAV